MESRERLKDQDLPPVGRQATASPTITVPVTDSSTPSNQPIPSGNIIGYLSLFFAQGSFVDKELSTFLTKEDEVRVLTLMLYDITKRKCSFHNLVIHLFTYCTKVDTAALDTHQLFLKAIWRLLRRLEDGVISSLSVRVLAKLVYAIPYALEDLLLDICQEKSNIRHEDIHWVILEESLKYSQEKEKVDCLDNEPRFIDDTFRLGESPLAFAALRRHYDLLHLFLRYGAKVETKWISFESVLEVLLFSPNRVAVSEQSKREVVKCIPLICSALSNNNLHGYLKKKQKSGYCEVISGWESELPVHVKPGGVASLLQLSRCSVREHLNRYHRLPQAINSLPIPRILHLYTDLYFQ